MRKDRVSLRMPATVGRRTPAYCSAVGKALLAFLSEAALDAVLLERPLRACTSKTMVTRAALLDDLSQTRTRGYSIDDEEIEKGLHVSADRSGIAPMRADRQRPVLT